MSRRRYHKLIEDDTFETEAFEYLNEEMTAKPKTIIEDESDVELEVSDEEGVKEDDNLLDETNRLGTAAAAAADDDDDDAPDSVDFGTSKATVIQQFRQAMDQIESEKKKKKEKRKKLDAQYKEQKSQKLKELSKLKLPEDVLESLDSDIPQKKKKKLSDMKEKKKSKITVDKDWIEADLLLDEGEKLSSEKGQDYIPLSSRIDWASGVEVLQSGEEKKKIKSAAESAAEFLKNRLYGSHIPRETTKQKMAKEEKRKARFR